MPAETPIPEICRRVEQVRRELHGNRGKVRFARQLGISPSTYNYYESGRIPPAEVLVRIADAGGVDLRWLLTGAESSPGDGSPAVPAGHPAIGRIAKLLGDNPDAAGPLMAFVDILAESLSWPAKAKAGAAKPQSPRGDVPRGAAKKTQVATADRTTRPRRAEVVGVAEPASEAAGQPKRDWIPILGRSAAGVPQFWADAGQAEGVTVLSDLVARYAGRSAGRVVVAVATGESGEGDQSAQIITMTDPDDEAPAEFVIAGSVKSKHPDAFAVRIDGDSMSPAIRHGDVVICSASASAADGSAAVVQLVGQIGVTCKVFRRAGDTVHLIPINEQYAPQSFGADTIVWARRVLARIRPSQ